MIIFACRTPILLLGAAFFSVALRAPAQYPLAKLDAYTVSWNEPGPHSAASMPIGNGDIGLNVWVEPGGDLLFYIAKTDSWGADVRGPKGLMKVGGVRVSFDPQP